MLWSPRSEATVGGRSQWLKEKPHVESDAKVQERMEVG